MPGTNQNPLSVAQIDADLIMADSGVQIDYSKMYRHSLDDLMTYAQSLGISLVIPSWVNEKKYVITGWEAEGRYPD